MTTKLEQAARQALDALEDLKHQVDHPNKPSWLDLDEATVAITALRESLAEKAEQEPISPYKPLSEDIWSKPFNSGAISEPVQPVSQEPTVSDGLCGGCAKKAADGWALYCVECWEKAEQEPVAKLVEMSKANFERHWGRNEFADWIYSDIADLFSEYAAPVRTKNLTDEEIADIFSKYASDLYKARAVIAADRKKNKCQ